MQAAELLEMVIADLERNGWCQGEAFAYGLQPKSSLPSACIWGAAQRASAGILSPGISTLEHLIVKAARELFADRMNGACSVIYFNDHPDTAYEDVILVLKHAWELALAEA